MAQRKVPEEQLFFFDLKQVRRIIGTPDPLSPWAIPHGPMFPGLIPVRSSVDGMYRDLKVVAVAADGHIWDISGDVLKCSIHQEEKIRLVLGENCRQCDNNPQVLAEHKASSESAYMVWIAMRVKLQKDTDSFRRLFKEMLNLAPFYCQSKIENLRLFDILEPVQEYSEDIGYNFLVRPPVDITRRLAVDEALINRLNNVVCRCRNVRPELGWGPTWSGMV
jgi:hypothetical protein